MTTLFFIFAGTVFALILALAAWEVIADRWAAYQDGAREAVGFADIRDLPETTAFDPKPDLPRARLRLVEPSNVVRIPEQRAPYDWQEGGL